MKEYMHSVTLDKESCKGCTTCIKSCPTGAIRVRGGKAKIIKERCIDCGECIRVCPYHAKKAITDNLEMLNMFKYNVALPAPSLYGQFDKDYSVDTILAGLLEIGFDDVYEVAGAAETVSAASRFLFSTGELEKPVISSACPVIIRLVAARFPHLLNNVIPLQAPADIAAKHAREIAVKKTELAPEEIGVFFISPCPAKATTVKSPIGIEKSDIDGVLAMKDVCLRVAHIISKITNPPALSSAGYDGIGWAKSGGEAKTVSVEDYIAADGIDNCIKLLEAIEDGRMENVEFVELSACDGGCVGGVLTVENPFISKSRIQKIIRNSKRKTGVCNTNFDDIMWKAPVICRPIMNLDSNILEAMKKMELMESIYQSLPQIDCGACGSPSCKSLAEDIVRGFAVETDCIFKLREKVHNLALEMMDLEFKLTKSPGTKEDNNEKKD